MSGSVRRAQKKIAKLENQLEAARIELIRQQELDVARAQRKAAREIVKKGDIKRLLFKLCIERNILYSEQLFQNYTEWKKVTELDHGSNRYTKMVRFLQENVSDKNGIPIYAKTMTGELIPLVYHVGYDKRDLQFQLQTVDPEQFPIGSTNICRVVEDSSEPVKEGEIFAIFQHITQYVNYAVYYEDRVLPGISPDNYPGIYYRFYVEPEGFTRCSELDIPCINTIDFDYYPDLKRFNYGPRLVEPYLIERLDEVVKNVPIYVQIYPTIYPSHLTQKAQEELIALIHTMRRDNL